jgi:ethanolamine ammonia-lyase small subunit
VHVAESEIVVRNGRVRVGYEIGALTGATVVIHLLGERPGTGLNTLSAYVTYGFDAAGRSRWTRGLDHSATTAICGIHPKGKAPLAAARDIASAVSRMIERRLSGVALVQRERSG